MGEKVNEVILPGDIILKIEKDAKGKENYKLGPGLRQESGNIISLKAGILRKKEPNILWIDNNQRKYAPTTNDAVIGIISKTGSENYRVEIGSNMLAVLGNLSFEGATKRNRPNLQIGDLVYAKLSIANRDMEPELTCIDRGGKNSGLGQLPEGFMITVSLGLARKLLQPDFLLLTLIGKNFPFEITVGLNGRIWIKSKGILNTIAVANAIVNSEFLTDEQMRQLVGKLVNNLQGF